MPVIKRERQRSYANLLGFKAEHGGDPARPENTLAPAVTGTPTVGETLTTTEGTWTGNPAPTFSIRWVADGAVIVGANALTYDLTPADAGKVIASRILASSIAGSATESSNETDPIAGAVPENTVAPAIVGTAKVGETLTVSDGTWDGTPAPTYAYQWFADDVEIVAATAATYDLTEAEEGAVITATVTASNIMGSDSADAPATAVVEAA